jgi:hypothetical protein
MTDFVQPSGFAISPASPGAPVVSQEFPQFLQIRVNGVDLGGPDVTVLDFVGSGFTVTRGTGADANKITIS